MQKRTAFKSLTIGKRDVDLFAIGPGEVTRLHLSQHDLGKRRVVHMLRQQQFTPVFTHLLSTVPWAKQFHVMYLWN